MATAPTMIPDQSQPVTVRQRRHALTRITGTGICVSESPVPADEVLRIDLKDGTLQVDGNFALMRTGRNEFSVEKFTRSLLGTITSGEGLLQTFRGTGLHGTGTGAESRGQGTCA